MQIIFKCSLEHGISFYRAAITVFAKIGRVASEEVTLQEFERHSQLSHMYIYIKRVVFSCFSNAVVSVLLC